MLYFIVIFVIITLGQCEEKWQYLCGNEKGSLYLENHNKIHIATTAIGKSGKIPIEFLSQDTFYKFKCDSNSSVYDETPLLKIDSNASFTTSHSNNLTVTGTLYHNETKNGHKGTNKEEILHCENICKIQIIIVQKKINNCSFKDKIFCKLNVEEDPTRNAGLPNLPDFNPRIVGTDIQSFDVSIENESEESIEIKDFEAIITYSVYDPHSKEGWLNCTEVDAKNKTCGINCLDVHTASIICPIDLEVRISRQVIIQIAEEVKDKKCVGLPIQCSNKHPKPKYSFMTVEIDKDNILITEPQKEDAFDNTIGTISYIVLGVVVGLILAVAVFLWYIKVKKRHISNKSSTFYVEDGKSGRSASPSSWKTENTNTTKLSDYQMKQFATEDLVLDYVLGSEQDENIFQDDSEEGVKKRKQIISRQLSGDPSKLNPDLPLNQQAKVLAYNPEYEIDFSNFKIGKLLGSGNFGCVFEGTANGIFHPGSVTKVAIKTVNDPLDRAQLGALLCEIKILASLDLNLNLVNLLGSCTSNLHNGDLYMLMEFCPHGNLKDFLIRHRQDFYSSIENNIAVNNLDDRLFLKWAHSIAKGMEYLYKKKIMHGDLAARNILIGGLEGNDENYVAKVSDFGLSKNFYDNYRYKKQNRDVPWKWMAYEYLKDGSFTMKSDVWSYGVVIWEILSLGQEPHAGKTFETIIKEFKAGYRLSCPQELRNITWSEEFYSKITEGCWQTETSKRYDFTKLVEILETYLTQVELSQHENLNEQYKTMRALLTNDETRLKRISTLPSIQDASYVKAHAVDGNTQYECHQTSQQTSDNSAYIQVSDAIGTISDPSDSSIMLQMAQNGSSYITATQAASMS